MYALVKFSLGNKYFYIHNFNLYILIKINLNIAKMHTCVRKNIYLNLITIKEVYTISTKIHINKNCTNVNIFNKLVCLHCKSCLF